jgi:hypothetical protein
MAWNLAGTYFENCSCDSVCPCTTSGLTMPADTDRCHVVLAFHVAEGAVEGLDVSGHTVVLIADTPPVMADGDWRLGMIIDDGASAEQAEALESVFGGQVGGPMAGLAPLIGEMLGVEQQPITFADDGRRHSLRVGDSIDIEIEDFVPPQLPDGDVTQITGLFHPANSTLTIARADQARVAAFGMEWDHSGKNGHAAPFAWSD